MTVAYAAVRPARSRSSCPPGRDGEMTASATPLIPAVRPSAAQPPPGRTRRRRTVLAGSLSVLVVAGVFGLAFPRIASYGQEWRSVTAITWPAMLLVTAAATASLVATWVMICAFLPRLRLRQAAAVS